MNLIREKLRRWLAPDPFRHLRRSVIEINNVDELGKIFGWKEVPLLVDPSILEFEYLEDVNQRRLRDAECLAAVMRNTNPQIGLEIGTATGHATALMALNAPQAKIFTVNIPPEEILSGAGGQRTTLALERDQIGAYYRERKLANITQILANTARWEPELERIDVAFVDGCHDAGFVYRDTRKILKKMKPGSFLLWHDFDLHLVNQFEWIHSVCEGVERLFAEGHLQGRVFHVRDSWVGIHRVG